MRIPLNIILPILIIFICACGGGTTGTGDIRSRTFSGTILSTESQPIANASLTLLESGDAVQTDDSGDFTLSSEVPEGNLHLLVELPDFEKTIELSNLDPAVTSYTLQIKVDVVGQNIELTSIKITVPPSQDSNDDNIQDDEKEEEEVEEVLKSIFKGQVIFEDGSSAKGVKVSLNGGASTTTNANGNFKIEQEYNQKNAELKFTYRQSKQNVTGTVKLSKLPDSAFVVEVKVKLYRIDLNPTTNEQLPDLELVSSKVSKR